MNRYENSKISPLRGEFRERGLWIHYRTAEGAPYIFKLRVNRAKGVLTLPHIHRQVRFEFAGSATPLVSAKNANDSVTAYPEGAAATKEDVEAGRSQVPASNHVAVARTFLQPKNLKLFGTLLTAALALLLFYQLDFASNAASQKALAGDGNSPAIESTSLLSEKEEVKKQQRAEPPPSEPVRKDPVARKEAVKEKIKERWEAPSKEKTSAVEEVAKPKTSKAVRKPKPAKKKEVVKKTRKEVPMTSEFKKAVEDARKLFFSGRIDEAERKMKECFEKEKGPLPLEVRRTWSEISYARCKLAFENENYVDSRAYCKTAVAQKRHRRAYAILRKIQKVAKKYYLEGYVMENTNREAAIARFQAAIDLTDENSSYHRKALKKLRSLRLNSTH